MKLVRADAGIPGIHRRFQLSDEHGVELLSAEEQLLRTECLPPKWQTRGDRSLTLVTSPLCCKAATEQFSTGALVIFESGHRHHFFGYASIHFQWLHGRNAVDNRGMSTLDRLLSQSASLSHQNAASLARALP